MTSKNLAHFILTTLLLGVAACGSPTDEGPIDADICRDAFFAGFEEKGYTTTFKPWLEGGLILNYDSDLKFLAFGEHAGAGPKNEHLGGLTLFYDGPRVENDECLATIVSLTVSTTDVRIGTAEKINAKLYKLAGPSENACAPEIHFSYVSSSSARGTFCANIQQVSPESGEPFPIGGFFAFPGSQFGN